MIHSKMLDNATFADEFARCCNNYSSLKIMTAWCGDPSYILPYSLLNTNGNNLDVEIIVGDSFDQSHPDAIQSFIDNNYKIRVFRRDIQLFHPKCYFFRHKNKYAIFVGSSNFTYSGFYKNAEINILLEGDLETYKNSFMKLFSLWRTDQYSFIPTKKWLEGYRKSYNQHREKLKKSNVKNEQDYEATLPKANWLTKANWDLYAKKVQQSFDTKSENRDGYYFVLDVVQKNLHLPLKADIFDELENRKIIGGMYDYAWFGNAAASGEYRGFMANPNPEKKMVIDNINKICESEFPINYKQLKKRLTNLTETGHSIKVWSRIITILRPEIFCTVMSSSLRKNLSEVLEIPQSRFTTVDGYIELIKIIHSCPWYNSIEPKDKNQLRIWKARAALMDAIFY